MSSSMTTDDEEQRLRIDLMTIQIERLRQEIRMENRKFAVQIVLALVAALGAGVAIGRFWLFHA
jgi:predicted type IV restriction endonuclease